MIHDGRQNFKFRSVDTKFIVLCICWCVSSVQFDMGGLIYGVVCDC
jgi:hypothetical protein